MTTWLTTLALLLQGLFIIALAPLITGWLKQLKVWARHSRAPKLTQPYHRLATLCRKEPLAAASASWLFRMVPYAYFTLMATLCFAMPLVLYWGVLSWFCDVIVLTGLLALARVLLVLAAMDIGTAFGYLGARRDLLVGCLSEPVLLLVFLNIALLTSSTHLSWISQHWLHHIALQPSLPFTLLAYLLLLLAENGRLPIDNAATHLELTMLHEAMLLEYSGRHLALIEYASMLKLMLYGLLGIALFCPYGLASTLAPVALVIGLLSSLAKLALLMIAIAGIETFTTKMRLFKIPDYLAGAFVLTVFGLLLTQLLR